MSSNIDLRCLRLLSDLVLVKVDPVETADSLINGLYRPASTQPKHEDAGRLHIYTRCGTVESTGPGKRSKKTGERMSMAVHPGDRVRFTWWTGQRPQGVSEPAPWDHDRLVMHESELLALEGPEKHVPQLLAR